MGLIVFFLVRHLMRRGGHRSTLVRWFVRSRSENPFIGFCLKKTIQSWWRFFWGIKCKSIFCWRTCSELADYKNRNFWHVLDTTNKKLERNLFISVTIIVRWIHWQKIIFRYKMFRPSKFGQKAANILFIRPTFY